VLYLPFSKPSELTQDASWILGSTHGSLGRLAGEFSSAYFSGQLPEWFRGNRKIIERAAKTAWKAAAKANGGALARLRDDVITELGDPAIVQDLAWALYLKIQPTAGVGPGADLLEAIRQLHEWVLRGDSAAAGHRSHSEL